MPGSSLSKVSGHTASLVSGQLIWPKVRRHYNRYWGTCLENKEIARVLWETADLMEIAGEDLFRIRSYRNGSTTVEGHPERIEDILRDPSRKVTEIPGIGKGLAHVLDEIVQSGTCERRDVLLEKFPPATLEFLKIQGLGPKGIALILEHYRIGSIDELERLCQEQKLRVLPRMGAKLEEKVLRSIAQYRQRSGRFLLSYAEGMAEELIGALGQVPGVDGITPACRTRGGRAWAISTCWSPGPRSGPRSTRSSRTRASRRCSDTGKTKPAPRWGAKACRWTCARCRPAASALPCNTSPAARTTTSPYARAP